MFGKSSLLTIAIILVTRTREGFGMIDYMIEGGFLKQSTIELS